MRTSCECCEDKEFCEYDDCKCKQCGEIYQRRYCGWDEDDGPCDDCQAETNT